MSKEDITGKDRMLWNTFVSWSSHFVLIISGFVMPRFMDQQLGSVQLGSWDFCWAFISYLKFAGLGVGNGSNRYVAKFRAEGDFAALSRLVSSVIMIQIFVGLSIMLATIVIIYLLPTYFNEQLGDNLSSIQHVIFYLGASLAVTMLFSASRGILTGYHRWDLHNGLTAVESVLSVGLMVFMLFSGYGIIGVAQAYLVNTIIFEVVRIDVVNRYCKGFSPSLSLVSKKQCWELVCFGCKNKLTTLPPVFILQSVNFMIVSALGLSILAVFARSVALTRHITTFMSKFTMMLTPSIGSMLAEGQREELNSFYITTTRLSFGFTLPLVITLAIFGDLIIFWWMGPDYVNQTMMIILALGVLLPAAQDSSLRMLMGMNEHGKISAYILVIVLVIFLFFYLYYLNFGLSLEMAALALVVPMNVAKGMVLPIYTCKKLKLNIGSYLYSSILIPLLTVIPFTLLALVAKYLYIDGHPILSLIVFCLSGIILIIFYGRYLLTKPQRKKILWKVLKK